jgi:UDP-N-acetylmuramoylalanine--D-glutamate ligase
MSHVLVLGGGVSGMAAARLARAEGAVVTIYDRSPTTVPLVEGFGVATGDWDPLLLRGIDLVIASPGFSERSIPIVETLEAGLPLVSEIEYAYTHLRSPVIAITGTNGKTSVTEATAAMLEASGLDAPAVGNIGAPLSDYANHAYDALVVEVSSFQLRFIDSFHPLAAAITNLADDHLDWHGSSHAYRAAKARIFTNQTADDLLVYDCDDPGATSLAAGAPSRLYPVSGHGLPVGGGGVEEGALRVMDVVIDVSLLHADDPMNLSNLACAAALAQHLGATSAGVTNGAISFRPGAHRRQRVAESGGVVWVDDSKATNPHAALASIRSFDSVVLIAGGLAKGLDVSPLGLEPKVKTGPAIVEAAGDRGRLAGTMEVAVEVAAQVAAPGDTVLLAPGCASFDQFESYAVRGDRFSELAKERTGERVG